MSTRARLTQLEQTVGHLISSRGERVSAALRLARQRSQQSEASPAPILRDLGELERQAGGRGLSADMAKAALRMLRGPALEALHMPGAVAKDAVVEAGGHSDALGEPRPSMAPMPAPTATSASGALVSKIDAVLLRAGGHV